MKKATKEKKVKHQSKRSFLIKNNEKNVMIKVKGTLIRIPLKKKGSIKYEDYYSG